MGTDKRKELKKVIESLIIATGREENTREFYKYLAETIEHPETRAFFEDIVNKESADIEQTENFLKELEDEVKELNNETK